jgi:H2-forming N5,N10-methylenetetrahydromethanopterin dehydrogenase-like enzyme
VSKQVFVKEMDILHLSVNQSVVISDATTFLANVIVQQMCAFCLIERKFSRKEMKDNQLCCVVATVCVVLFNARRRISCRTGAEIERRVE